MLKENVRTFDQLTEEEMQQIPKRLAEAKLLSAEADKLLNKGSSFKGGDKKIGTEAKKYQ